MPDREGVGAVGNARDLEMAGVVRQGIVIVFRRHKNRVHPVVDAAAENVAARLLEAFLQHLPFLRHRDIEKHQDRLVKGPHIVQHGLGIQDRKLTPRRHQKHMG